jgi:ABC-type branched-subunit amino acid transport system ATPase component/MFS family permease
VSKVRAGLNRYLETVTGGAVAFPLIVLTTLYALDQFDTAAFGVLAPNIEKAFHLSDQSFILLVIVNLSIVLALAIPVGFLGDRVPRTKLVVIGGIVAGVFSFFTGLVGTVALLAFVRIGNGVGQLVNDPIHNSLLADYHTPDRRPRVYGWHANGQYIGAAIGPAVAGLVAYVAGWRAAFMVLIVPCVAISLSALRLREPRRGGTDDPDAAAEAEAEAPVAFREGARTLWAIPTLRRQYIAYFVLGAGIVPLVALLSLYLQRTFHLGPFDRGMVLSVNAAFSFAGVLYAGRRTTVWLGQGLDVPIRRTGAVLAAVGVGVLLIAVAPTLWLALPLGFATSLVAGMYFPPFLTTQALVSPARVRSLSFSIGAVALVLGVWVIWLPLFGSVSDNDGIRWGIGVLTPFFLISGAILASAGRYVADDTAAALRTLGATVRLRRQRIDAQERSLLLCSGVNVAYESVQVLFGVELEVAEGEIVALLGTNGAGKSTLLKGISGLVEPSGGAILFDGRDITHLDARTRAGLGIVQMPGGRSIFPTLTVNECLRLAGWMYKRDTAHIAASSARVREYFPVLVERADALAGNLSGGEQQMLGLAMALIAKPRLLMIDELSLGLAPAIVGQLIEIVRAIHAQGTTVILVEQSVNVALLLAHRAVFMEKGEIRFTGPTSELLGREDVLRSVFLEGAASVTTNGHHAVPAVARRLPPAPDARVRLDLQDIVVAFGGVRAVDGASLQAREGEIVGLIGPNGAGKTTIFDAISGFVVPVAGRVLLDGEDITGWSPNRRGAAGLGRSFQDARIFPSLTVAENIAVGLERHIDIRDPVACALGLPAVAESEEEVAWRVHDLIELLGLGAFRNKFVGELSTGSRRIVDLAMAIAHQPKVLILDEPSSGIAQRETEALGPLLQRIQREVGCSMLVIEHDMPLITGVADTMVALELGTVIATGRPEDVVRHPLVIASYLGTEAGVIARSGAVAPAAGETNGNGAAARRARPLRARPTAGTARN